MHKCPNCGTEFESKFCPECGNPWQEEKACPNCGAHLNGSAKFCPECGYSFRQAEQPKKAGGFSRKLGAARNWVKKHLKIVIPVAIALVAVIILLSLIPTFIVMGKNGTYYRSLGGEVEKSEYVVLKNGKWKDETGSSGKYSISGNTITLYFHDELFGGTEKIKGTVSGGVLIIEDMGVFRTEGHKHKYGEWKQSFAPTCVDEGLENHKCDCNKSESRTIPATGHKFENGICSACGEAQLEYTLNGSTYTVKINEAGKESTEVVILAEYNSLPVTSIAASAFEGCTNLTGITIPDSITEIGGSAFGNCDSLKTVYYTGDLASWCGMNGLEYLQSPDRKIYIDGNVLTDLAGSLTIPDNVTVIGEHAFEGCSKLTSVTVPDGVTKIGGCAFQGCSKLTSVTIPDSVTKIGGNAFEGCSGLTSITLPNGLTEIGWYAFRFCSGLTSIHIPKNVTEIGYQAFDGCSGLTSITVEEGNANYHSAGNCLIETESKVLLLGCSDSEIPTDGSVIGIGTSAFYNCKFTSFTVPECITGIGDYAFDSCENLTSITIPGSVTEFGWKLFAGCKNLTSITYHGTKAQWNQAIDTAGYWYESIQKNLTVHCTDGDITVI